MAEPGAVIVVGHRWRDRGSELAFVTRSIAGAASRGATVSILAPGAAGSREPDGAFDLLGMGTIGDFRWPERLAPAGSVVVDDLTQEMRALVTGGGVGAGFFLSSPLAEAERPGWRRLHLVRGGEDDPSPWVTVHVPVNPLAQLHRHHGFGFTGYQLVLSDRSGPPADPPPAVTWLSGAFPAAEVVVIADGLASAWKGRALRGTVHVDTRMDLWRLLAHAGVCIDLAPGAQIARECIEALRFGTPIVVPDDSGPAALHARAGGGATFGDPGDLIAAVTTLQDESNRSAASEAGRRYAETRYGDAGAFVARVRALFTGPLP